MAITATPIVAIAIIMYILSEILKGTVFKNNADMKAVIPYFCALIGAVLAVVAYLVNPALIGCDNILDAIVKGAVSGLVATGANQAYKQFYNLLAVGKSVKEDVDKTVENMTPEEKKEYLSDTAAEFGKDVLDKIKEKTSTTKSSGDIPDD